MERGHRANAPARRTPGLEGIAPVAGRELRDRRRGHQDSAGRKTALTFFESPSGLLSLHRKSAFSSPGPQKLGAFFILGSFARLRGTFMLNRLVVMAAAAVLTACAAPKPAAAPLPASGPAKVVPPLKSGLDLTG